MACVEIKCFACGSTEVIKHGKNPNGHQRYRCKSCNKTFQIDYTYKACAPGVRDQIIEMIMNSSGTRDTARTLGISKDTVTSALKELENSVKPVNEEYLKKKFSQNKPINIEIRNALSSADGLSVEMDEMWSYYLNKKKQVWLWWAVDHDTNIPLAFTFGDRTDDNLFDLLMLLEGYEIGKVYTDNNFAYSRIIPYEVHCIGKRNTQKIERQHLTLRTRIKRLSRKTICFSKNREIHKAVIGYFINRELFKSKNYTTTIL